MDKRKNIENWLDAEDSNEETLTKTSYSDVGCSYCKVKSFKSASEFKKHEDECITLQATKADKITFTDGSKRFLCNICFRLFKYFTGLSKHKKWHEPPGGFICRYCDARFCLPQTLEQHKQETHKVYKCQICKNIFDTTDKYVQHIKDEHDGFDCVYYKCDDCGFQFKSKTVLEHHKETKCGNVKPFACDECGSSYHTKTRLTIHKKIHQGEKAFCCSYCGKGFLRKGQLNIHERKHTGEKPYKCDLCSKAFAHRESLVTHSSVHTGVKPYMCSCCKARFSCVGNLQKHRAARPTTCGLPEYRENKKAAPRPSIRIPGSLTSSNIKITKASIVIKGKSKTSEEVIHQNTVQNEKVENVSEQNEVAVFEVIEEDHITSNCTTDADDPETINDVQTMEIIDVLEDQESAEQIQHLDIQILNEEDPFKLEDQIEETVEINTKPTHKENVSVTETVNIADIISSETIIETIPEVVDNVNEKSTNYNVSEIYDSTGVVFTIYGPNDEDIKEETNLPFTVIQNAKQSDIVYSKVETLENCEYDSEPDEDNTPLDQDYSNVDVLEIDDKDFISNVIVGDDDGTNANLRCWKCPKIYQQRKPFFKHLKNDHQVSEADIQKLIGKLNPKKLGRYKCKYCGKLYNIEKSLEKHIKSHGPEGNLIYKSSCCKTYFPTKSDANEHVLKNHGEMVTCTTCKKIYPDPQSLSSHKRYAHPVKSTKKQDKLANTCRKCDTSFASKTTLRDHERSDCGRNPLYGCNVCKKHFHSAGSLKIHKKIHTGDLSHICTYCGKAFRTQGQVKVHQRKHNGEKPFKCEMCPKEFAYRESLLTHISIHTGFKRFMCHACGRQFSCISNLQIHRKTYKSTCGSAPNATNKAVGGTVGFANGMLYIGSKNS